MLSPFALEERFERGRAARQLELAEDVGLFGRLVLGLEVDIVGSLGIGAGADQDEFGAFVIEQTRVFGREAPAAELALERFRIMRLVPLWQASTGRGGCGRIADREDEGALALDI